MTVRGFDRDFPMPVDEHPFAPGPEFYSALDLAVSDEDLDVRYHAAEQVVLCLQGAALKAEAARDVLQLVLQIRKERSVSSHATSTWTDDSMVSVSDSDERDIFGDNGILASVIGQVVSLKDPSARRWAFSALAVQVVNEIEREKAHAEALSRFVRFAKAREGRFLVH